jgi:glutamate N-acetyltransferase/amino-acid N-acetyltransferase
MMDLKRVEGGVTAPARFVASGVSAGIKGPNLDLALVVSQRDAAVAGTFTRNRIQGAHIALCRDRVAHGSARAIVVNSGNANACNGPQGATDAARMAEATAGALGVDASAVLVCSTGTIGIAMPMERIEPGIDEAVKQLAPDGGAAAARAIMTTDTVPKEAAVEFVVEGRPVRVGGIAKGAGMIEPNMATMLAFLTTDAAVMPEALQRCLSEAVEDSFNRISVDGDQSCNDTVLLMANGAAGNAPLHERHPAWDVFRAAVHTVARTLAFKIVQDGEGATRFVTVEVRGAATGQDARLAARAIANSLLVKTSWFGGDPNWGRVIDAVGYSGAAIDPDRVAIWYDDVCAAEGGCRCRTFDIKALEAVLARPEFSVRVNLNMGDATDTVYTCDCSEAYVRINSEYMT